MTSQGAQINGLDARQWISAGYACHIFGSKKRAYIRPGYEQTDEISTPIVDITDGTTVGFRYLQFGNNSPKTVTFVLEDAVKGKVQVRLDSYHGRVVAAADLDGTVKEVTTEVTTGIVGKHAIYFAFMADDKETTFIFDRFTFD